MVRKKCKKLMNDQNFEEENFMDFFGVLTMLGGLALFLYGMETMGNGLEKLSGGRLERILEKLTSNPIKAVLLGAGVTAVIQSSSATTVMVVGFVNSGIMKLTQAVGIIMGANIGTTVTSWLLSLTGIESGNFFVRLLKPTSFSPVLALIGVCFIMFSKKEKKKDAGTIMIGFAILMTGMETMSGAVKPLANVPEFTGIVHNIPASGAVSDHNCRSHIFYNHIRSGKGHTISGSGYVLSQIYRRKPVYAAIDHKHDIYDSAFIAFRSADRHRLRHIPCGIREARQ